MTPEEIKQAVHAALKEHKDEFWIAAEQHYQDHQALLKCRSREDERLRRTMFVNDLMELGEDAIRDNHEFVRMIRDRRDEAWKIGWKIIIVGGIGFFGMAIWAHVLSLVRVGK
jgi:hypothetical protein